MEINGRMVRYLKVWLTLLLLVLAAGAEAATVSGTVTNNTSSAGRVFLVGRWSLGGNTGWGKSVTVAANSTATYSIQGVQDGSYVVEAFLDTQNGGIHHANDPFGTSAPFNVTGGADVANVNVSLSNPASVPLQSPAGALVVSGDGGVMVMWDPATDQNGREIATSYQVYWSTSPNPGPLNMTGGGTSGASPSLGDVNVYFKSFANGTQLYFSVTAKLGGVESAPVNAYIKDAIGNYGLQVTVGPATGGVTVSGTVTTTGATLGAGKPLYLALAANDGPPQYVGRIAAPSTSQAYSILGVPTGSYGLYAIVDMNNNGFFDLGDLSNTESDGVPVTVAGTDVTNANVSLVSGDATVSVKTEHSRHNASDWYSLNLQASANKKRPVNAAVSGPNLAAGTIDLAVSDWGPLEAWPNLTARPTLVPSPDTYSFAIEYDGQVGTSQVTSPVTGIVDSFATPVSPAGFVSYPFPGEFSWSAPASPPTPYTYSFWLDIPGFNDEGFYSIPSSTTNATYYADYADGNYYTWNISVIDSHGNKARRVVDFTPTSSPVITGFSPTSGVPGTQVTITGFNFDPIPANNQVSFNDTQATIVSATDISLVVTVPNGAAVGSNTIGVNNLTTGKFGSSAEPYQVLPVISFSGNVKDSSGVNLSGVTVTLVGTSNSVTTDVNGDFTLYNIPSNADFSLIVSKTGYATEYSGINNSQTNISGRNFKLYNLANLQSSWGLQAGKGVVVGYVKTLVLGGNYQNVQGASVSISGSSPPASYTVQYDNGSTDQPAGGSVTSSTGRFYVLNVAPGTTLTMTASKNGATFPSPRFVVYTDAVTYGAIRGNDVQAPVVTGFTTQSPVSTLSVPITTFTATDNIGIAGYLITESNVQPGIYAPWSATKPTTYSVSGTGSHTLYGWVADAAGNVSLSSAQTVIVDQTAPVVTANPAGGMFSGSINVYLTANEPATIYYTTNGATPTISSPSFVDNTGNVQQGPIVISTNTTLKYFAKDLAGNSSVIQTQTYTPSMVKVGTTEFQTIQSAYDDAATLNNSVLKVKAGTLTETDTFGRNIAVTLDGGYDSTFGSVTGTTKVKGKLQVRSGTLRVRKVAVY